MRKARGFDTAHSRLDVPGGERFDVRFTPLAAPSAFAVGETEWHYPTGANIGMAPAAGRGNGVVRGPGVDGAVRGKACTVDDVDVTPSSLFVAGGVNRSRVLEEGSVAYVAMGRRWPEYLARWPDGELDQLRRRLRLGVEVADDLSPAYLAGVRPPSPRARVARLHRDLGQLRNSHQYTDRVCTRGPGGDLECSCFVCFAVGTVMEMVHSGAARCL